MENSKSNISANKVKIENFNNDLTIYAFKIKDNPEKGFFTRIRELYEYLKEKGYFETIQKKGMYALTKENKDGIKEYWVGCIEELEGSIPINIENGVYAISKATKDDQEDIVKKMEKVYGLLKNENINYESNYVFEQYIDGKCLIYVKLDRDLTNEKPNTDAISLVKIASRANAPSIKSARIALEQCVDKYKTVKHKE